MLRHICYPTPSFYLPSPGCFKGWMWLKNLSWIKHYQYSNYIEVVEISVFWITRSWWNNRQWIWVTLQQLLLLLNRILFCFWKVINLSVSSRSYCHSVTARSQVPSQLDSHSVSCQSISQSISLSVSQSIKQSRSQAFSQSASQSVSQSVSQVSQSVICQSVSNQLVTSQSVSQSVSQWMNLKNNDMSSVSQSLDVLMITILTVIITLGWKGPSTIQPHSIKPTNNNDTQTKNLSTLGVAAFNVTKRTWNNNTV